MNYDMLSYYSKRAGEYERIYLRPERQADLRKLTGILQQTFSGKELLEIACGTGYWTQCIAKTARSIKAIDINQSVLEIAKTKNYTPAKVSFEKADMFVPNDAIQYQSLFGGFIWSHIKLQQLPNFIDTINGQVEKGGTIVFVDNRYVEGSSLPITSQDADGNTYQQRKLDDGSEHTVVKNFPSKTFIKNLLKGKAVNLDFSELEHYWILKYKRL